jgi:hypothetical protein
MPCVSHNVSLIALKGHTIRHSAQLSHGIAANRAAGDFKPKSKPREHGGNTGGTVDLTGGAVKQQELSCTQERVVRPEPLTEGRSQPHTTA